MIKLQFKKAEFYNEETNEFVDLEDKTVDFEYSLLAISKWESKWKIPYLTYRTDRLDEKLIDFYLCMSNDDTLTKEYITDQTALLLSNYISDPQTATTFSGQNGDKSSKVYTSEEIYALMFLNSIPLEFEARNLNKLLVVLRIIAAYKNPPKKMSQQEILQQNARLNAERKKQYNTRG